MNAIASRQTLYVESLHNVTLEALVAAVSESIRPGEEAVIAHVVNRILREGQVSRMR